MKSFAISCRAWELEGELELIAQKQHAIRETNQKLINDYDPDQRHLMDWCKIWPDNLSI